MRFAFITGVSKFSRVSVFSDLNNLQDLTMDTRFATLCGFTQEELEANFAGHLERLDVLPLLVQTGYLTIRETVGYCSGAH